MKIKHRTKPLPLKKLEALTARLSPQFPRLAEVNKAAMKRKSGYAGELKVDYHLDMLANRYTILDDVYLQSKDKHFQIDSLVIAEHGMFIIDTKHYQRSVKFDTIFKQLIRHNGSAEAGLEYPVTQVENQTFHLQNWLHSHQLSHIPLHYFVAIADPATTIHVDGDREALSHIVAHAAEIPKMISKKDEELEQIGHPQLEHYEIGTLIGRECREFDLDIINEFEVSFNDLLPGVICPECGVPGMERVTGGWICLKCKDKNSQAHLKDLNDFLLLNGWITNKLCRWLLGLPSRSTATRILKQSGFTYTKKNRYWIKS